MVTIPKSWRVFKVADVAEVSRGASPRPIESYLTSNVNGVNWIKIGDAPRNGNRIGNTAEHITPEGALRSVIVRAGDLILSNSMSFGRPYVLDINGCIHDGWLKLSEFSRSADTEFLVYLLSSRAVTSQYESLAAGSGVKNLNKEVVREVALLLPQLAEQRAIAEVLAGFDEHLANLDELIAKKKNIRDGTLESLVSGEQRVGVFKYPWREVPLDSIAHSRRESVGSELMSMDVELENIVPGEGRLVGDTGVRTASSFIFRTGDVLFGRLRPYLRKFWYATNTGFRSGEIWALVAKEEVDSKFLFHLVRTQCFLDSAGKTMGTKMPRADWNLMKSQRFCIPHSLEEQRAIAEVLSGMDEEISLLDEERAKIEALKLGAMDDLLTGRVRLPVEEEVA